MKLPVKIGIIVSAVAIPAAALFLFLIYGMIRASTTLPIEQRQQDIATQTLDSIDRYLYERTHELKITSQSVAIHNLAASSTNPATRTQAATRLTEVSEPTDSWDRLDVVDKRGLIAASTTPDLVGSTILEESDHNIVVQKALTGEITYSNVILENGKPTMIFAIPIQPSSSDAGQPTSAVLTGHLNWQEIIDLLRTVPHDSVNLYNKQGTQIGNKDNLATLDANHSSNQAVSKGLAGESGSLVVGDNLISFTGEHGYKDYIGDRWALTIATPTDAIFAPATEVAINIAVMMSLWTLGVMTTITFLVGRVIRPISRLTQSANRLALGDLTQRVKVTAKNEIGELGIAFNNMADKLQQLYKNLELKVQQKTAQLAEEVNKVDAERAKDEAIITSIGEGIIAVDSEGAVVKINQPAIGILGLQGSIIGKKLVDTFVLYDDYDKEVPLEKRPSVKAVGSSGSSEELYTIHRKDGAKVKVVFLSTPILQQGKVLGGIMILRDVTKEREVDRMKTEFISLASHQLRTPLSAIKWFSEMMVSGDAGEMTQEQQEFIKNIYDSTERMIDLVNSLLNISRMESGRIIVDPKPTDLHELVNGIINDLKAKTEEKQQSLVVSVHKDLPKINLDPRLIGQVYMNFLTNAIKYTPKGGEIAVFISRKGDEVVSQITDNGYGIPAAQQSKLFQKFFRAENIVKVETDGTGLGLYLVKAIIESSGGKVWFKSEESKGTTFWFSLPMSGMKAKAGEVTLDV